MIFTIPAKDKNSVKAIIGDELSSPSDFLPSIKLSRWDGEVSFKAGFDVSAIPKGRRVFSNLGNSNYKLATPLLDFKIYPLPSGSAMEDGGLEFEIILKSPPPTNIITMPIETAGLDFHYQTPFTEQFHQGDPFRGRIIGIVTDTEVKDNAGNTILSCPENVSGSYAVYHSTKSGDFSGLGGKNYKAGKAFHIYRPKLIDNVGTSVWGSLNIDVQNHLLTVVVPQAFLDSAVYPIRHAAGLTLGFSGIGGTGYTNEAGWVECTAKGQATASGNSSKITLYCSRYEGTPVVQMGFYTDNSGVPDALVAADAGSIAVPAGGLAWLDSNSIIGALTSGSYYWPAWLLKQSGGGIAELRGDTLSLGTYERDLDYESLPSSISGFSAWNIKQSIYITYTAGGAAQTLYPDEIAGAEAFGSHQLNFILYPTAIVGAEAFGTHQLNFTLYPSEIASVEAFGTHQLNFTLYASEIITAESVGSPQLNFTVYPSAIAGAEAFGTAQLNFTLYPTAVGSNEAFGTLTITVEGQVTAIYTGIFMFTHMKL